MLKKYRPRSTMAMPSNLRQSITKYSVRGHLATYDFLRKS